MMAAVSFLEPVAGDGCEPAAFPIKVDNGDGEGNKFRVAVAEIRFAVVGPGRCGSAALGAIADFRKLTALAGPTTIEALDAIPDAAEQHIEGSFEHDSSIKS